MILEESYIFPSREGEAGRETAASEVCQGAVLAAGRGCQAPVRDSTRRGSKNVSLLSDLAPEQRFFAALEQRCPGSFKKSHCPGSSGGRLNRKPAGWASLLWKAPQRIPGRSRAWGSQSECVVPYMPLYLRFANPVLVKTWVGVPDDVAVFK